MRAMVSSVKDKGVTQPAIVRSREDGSYEIVSGHRRQKVSELPAFAAGLQGIPLPVRLFLESKLFLFPYLGSLPILFSCLPYWEHTTFVPKLGKLKERHLPGCRFLTFPIRTRGK